MHSQLDDLRPQRVGLAIKLFWVSLVLGVCNLVFDSSKLSAGGSATATAIILIFSFAVVIFLMVMVSKGHNWARFTLLVLFILGVLPLIPIIAAEFARAPLSTVIIVVQDGLQAYGLFLLFTESSNPWFRGESVESNSDPVTVASQTHNPPAGE